jgi:hypothetical protein
MLADCLYRSLTRRPLWVGTVIDIPNAGKAYPYSGARALGYLGPKADEKGFNIRPRYVGPRWFPENGS